MIDQPSRITTAGIIIIGNEILSGKVHDSNSFFLASELRALGVNVMRISVIPDDIETIGQEAALFSRSFDYVFTSGGVGPTHDDVTMEGIASGFGVRLVRNSDLEERLRARYGESVNDAVLKMAAVPEGSEIIARRDNRFPAIAFRNIFIFPGIPRYLEDKFISIRERFRAPSLYLRRLFLHAEEADIASELNAVVAEHPGVAFGSYPVLDNEEYTIIVTAEARSEDMLLNAMSALITRIPTKLVVRIE